MTSVGDVGGGAVINLRFKLLPQDVWLCLRSFRVTILFGAVGQYLFMKALMLQVLREAAAP